MADGSKVSTAKRGVAGALAAVVMTAAAFVAGTAVPQRDPITPPLPADHAPRSSKWPAFRDRYIAAHPACIVCGTTHDVQAHHLIPYHLHPELELDPANVRTFCRRHHFLQGHLEDWRSFNATAEADGLAWKERLDNRPKGDTVPVE